MSDAPKADRPASLSDTAVRPVTIGRAQTPLPNGADPTLLAPARVDPHVGKTIDGRYVVERVIGEGGMGIVYAARHKMIDKRVAIKVLRGEMALDKELNERFLQEARAASAIGNPHIVDISDFGQLPDGSTYFTMEFLDGKGLGALLTEAQGAIGVPRLCHIAKQIAQGLSAAHAANIVHRDLKPDNVILVTRGRERDFVKILDFGIAKVDGGTKKMTRAGSVFGTPHYMSPEQAAGAAVDRRTDIYALGVILYEMATGKVPFDADNFMGILTQHMYKAPVPIRALVPEIDVPPGLDAIVLKCLSKKPEGRYGAMDELVLDLEKLEQGTMPDAVGEMMGRSGGFNVPADYFRGSMPEPVPASPPTPRKRWPLYATMGAVATLLGVIGIILARSPSSPAQTAPAGLVVAATPPPVAAAAPTALVPVAVVAVPAPPVASTARATHEVLVSVVPSDATITRDGVDLGQLPLALQLGDGESATVVIARKGYKTKTVKIDDSAPRRSFALDPANASGAAKPASAGGGGGIDDVGDPFARKH
jgi:tRNA A-37 threonylcarbamoyl transferase component Bud32